MAQRLMARLQEIVGLRRKLAFQSLHCHELYKAMDPARSCLVTPATLLQFLGLGVSEQQLSLLLKEFQPVGEAGFSYLQFYKAFFIHPSTENSEPDELPALLSRLILAECEASAALESLGSPAQLLEQASQLGPDCHLVLTRKCLALNLIPVFKSEERTKEQCYDGMRIKRQTKDQGERSSSKKKKKRSADKRERSPSPKEQHFTQYVYTEHPQGRKQETNKFKAGEMVQRSQAENKQDRKQVIELAQHSQSQGSKQGIKLNSQTQGRKQVVGLALHSQTQGRKQGLELTKHNQTQGRKQKTELPSHNTLHNERTQGRRSQSDSIYELTSPSTQQAMPTHQRKQESNLFKIVQLAPHSTQQTTVSLAELKQRFMKEFEVQAQNVKNRMLHSMKQEMQREISRNRSGVGFPQRTLQAERQTERQVRYQTERPYPQAKMNIQLPRRPELRVQRSQRTLPRQESRYGGQQVATRYRDYYQRGRRGWIEDGHAGRSIQRILGESKQSLYRIDQSLRRRSPSGRRSPAGPSPVRW